jgi:thioredoxin
MVIDLDKNAFHELIGSSIKPVVVQVWAPWCGPCQYFKPIMESLASDYDEDIAVARINMDEQLDLARELNVMDIPTVIVFNNGRQDKVIVGAHEREDMVTYLDKYLTR